MEFFILGPLEVRDGDNRIPLTARRQKVLLALLLLSPNEVVSRDRLIEELWRGRPPETAENALHGLVSQVRKLLESRNGAPMPLVTRPPGYALEIDPEAIDLHRFERLLARGRQALGDDDAGSAADLLREALGLWRGRPLADLGDAPFVQPETDRLEELRLQALEGRIEADLQLGRARELVPELQTLVAREPYRERLRHQLMLALYRSGRQAGALAAYRDARRLLIEELGVEPGPALQELERMILRQEPSLDLPEPPARRSQRRRRLRWALVAAALVAVAGGAAAFMLLRGGSGAEALTEVPPNSIAVIDPKTNRLVDYVRVGARPIAVAVGEGAVWAVNTQDGTLSRIDPKTREVVRTIGIGTPATEVAVGFGSVWVANGTDGSVARIDPRANAVAETLRAPPERLLVSPAVSAVAVGAGSVWLTSGTRHVLRLDPSTGHTTATVSVPAGPLSLAFGDGAVWVGSLARRASRIEPRTNTVTAKVPVQGYPVAIAVGEGAVWTAVCCDSVWRIDPTTNVLTGTIRVGSLPNSVAVGDHAVWVANYGDGTVSRIDPTTGSVVETIHTGHGAVAVAVGYGAVWVAVEQRNVS